MYKCLSHEAARSSRTRESAAARQSRLSFRSNAAAGMNALQTDYTCCLLTCFLHVW